MSSYVALTVFLIVTAAAATTGGLFTPGPWYETLAKPSWTPPNWAFPVVWTILYIMIAIAGWLVWDAKGLSLVVGVWGVQLVLNAAWSWIMFGQKNITLALWDAGAMWLAIAAFIALAWPVSRTAALLFLPYLAWVSIAFYLNWTILRLNPAA